MLKQLFLFLLVFVVFDSSAQGKLESSETAKTAYRMDGIIETITSDMLSVSHLTGKTHPKVGQKVTVDKRFQNGMFSGTHSLAEGTITKSTSQAIEIKVSKYTSTMVENGKTRPMATANDHAIIEWTGSGQQLNESSSDSKEDLVNLQKKIDEAQALIKARKYKEAVGLLEPSVGQYHDCYACHYVLGHAYYELHEEEKAIYQMSQVIKGQPKKYSMAYIWRARAYASNYPHQYEKAIEDYRLVLEKYAEDKATKSYILKEIIELQDKQKDYEKACLSVKELQKIEGETADNKDLYNHYCLGIKVPKKKHIRFDAFVTKQSEDLQTFTAKLTGTPEDCYYSEYFDGAPEYQKAEDIKVGAMVEISSCNKGSKMGIAVAKIISVKGDVMEIEVLYWTNKINGHPWRQTFKSDKPLTFAW